MGTFVPWRGDIKEAQKGGNAWGAGGRQGIAARLGSSERRCGDSKGGCSGEFREHHIRG